MSGDARRRLAEMQDERGRMTAAQAVSAAELIKAEGLVREAQQRIERAGDLLAAGNARAELLHARQAVAAAQAEIASRAATLSYLVEEIEALRELMDEAGRLPPDASETPWHIGAGTAGRIGIYSKAGAFIGEIQSPIDARLIIGIINRAARAVVIESGANELDPEGVAP